MIFGTPQKHHFLRPTRRKNRKKHLADTHIQQKIKKHHICITHVKSTHKKYYIPHTYIHSVHTTHTNIPPKHPQNTP